MPYCVPGPERMLMLEGCTTASCLGMGVKVGALVFVAVGALVLVAVGTLALGDATVERGTVGASVGALAPGVLQPVRASAALVAAANSRKSRRVNLTSLASLLTAKTCGSPSLIGLSDSVAMLTSMNGYPARATLEA